MRPLYWPCLMFAAGFLIWAHTHTDELPIVLGFVLIVSGILAAAFPEKFLVTAVVTGLCLFIAETLVHFSVLKAPYPPTPGRSLPWVALFGYVPAILGVGTGAVLRRLVSGPP